MEPDPSETERSKRELRTRMRHVTRTIAADPATRLERSRMIGERVVAALVTAWPVADEAGRRLMVYEPLPGEPDLTIVLEWAATNAIDVFVPEVDGVALRVMPGDVDPSTLNAVVVPGLAFTRDGHRLGQGGGHFDRFLSRLGSGCLVIGVAFIEQLVGAVPLEAHDVMLDLVVTDE